MGNSLKGGTHGHRARPHDGSGPRSSDNMEINRRGGGRGFYFKDANGHLFEVLT
jgi:catechol 2,3-dioxygenase-like lactoylglutathione lyase family enzyme